MVVILEAGEKRLVLTMMLVVFTMMLVVLVVDAMVLVMLAVVVNGDTGSGDVGNGGSGGYGSADDGDKGTNPVMVVVVNETGEGDGRVFASGVGECEACRHDG